MLDIEEIVLENRTLIKSIDYTPYTAKPESTGRAGTLYDIDITSENNEFFNLKVMQFDNDGEISVISFTDEDGMDVFPQIEGDLDNFKDELQTWIEEIIDEIE